MFGSDANSFDNEVSKDVAEIKKISDDFNKFLDDCYKLYDFLSENRNYWEVDTDSNTILFLDDSKVNKYNELLNNIIEDVNAISFDDNINMDKDSDSNSVGSV